MNFLESHSESLYLLQKLMSYKVFCIDRMVCNIHTGKKQIVSDGSYFEGASKSLQGALIRTAWYG